MKPLSFLVAFAFLNLSLPRAAAQTNPPKLAATARLDLNASPGVVSLRGGTVTVGSGSIDRQTWLPATDWELTYYLQLPIVRFAWNEFAVQFVPAGSGTVQLSLRGPWEEVVAGTGTIYREEVLWDALQATGASIVNGGFESVTGGAISSWSGGVSQTATPAVPAVEGSRMARTWHNNSMTQNLIVTAGVPVTLRFFARAYVPAGFQDMQPVASRNTAAHRTALKFMRGVNFGNFLELPPASPASLSYGAADFAQARAEGFDHVRLPVAWQYHAGPAPTFTISNSILAKVDGLVTQALNQGLGVIVDLHNFEEFTSNPLAVTNKFYALWGQLAAHFSNAPPTVVFELLNEPRDPATTAVMNPIFREAIRQIRPTNPNRTLLLGPGAFNGISELNNLLLPDDDTNLMVTVHTYDPFLFTHQGLSWAGADVATTPIVFPGPPGIPVRPAAGLSAWATNWINDYNTLPPDRNPGGPAAFRERLRMIRQWSDYYGRPVHVGEFGAIATIEGQSRINYYREIRRALDESSLGWAIWDWKAGFHYLSNGLPDPPGIREALFPSPLLQSRAEGVIELVGSVGKVYTLERAFSLIPPIPWQTISTQTFVAPEFRFVDPGTNLNPAAFYRVNWVR